MKRCHALRRLIGNLRRSERGLAIIEFALLLPIMVMIYFATSEITQTVIAKRKLNLAVFTLTDLTTQSTTVTSTDLTTIFSSAAAVMNPLDVSGLQMRVTSVVVNPGGTVCVDWSYSNSSSLPAAAAGSSTFAVPSTITSSVSLVSRDFIVAEVRYPYDTGTHGFIPGIKTLSDGPTYMEPRKSNEVLADSSVQANASKCTFISA